MEPAADTATDQAAERKAARRAGWRRADIAWEQLQEEANRLWRAGDREGRCLRGQSRSYRS